MAALEQAALGVHIAHNPPRHAPSHDTRTHNTASLHGVPPHPACSVILKKANMDAQGIRTNFLKVPAVPHLLIPWDVLPATLPCSPGGTEAAALRPASEGASAAAPGLP